MSKGYAIFVASIALAFYLWQGPQGDMQSAKSGNGRITESKAAVVLVSAKAGVFDPASWYGTKKPNIYNFEADKNNPAIFYAATDSGVYISKNGGYDWYPFTDIERQLDGAKIYAVKSVKTPAKLYIAAYQDRRGTVYETEGQLFSLKKIFDAEETAVESLDFANGNLYLGLSDGRLLQWNGKTKEFKLEKSFGSAITSITINQEIYVETEKGLYVSSPRGYELMSSNPIQSLALDRERSVYIASLGQLFQSANRGRTWQILPTINPPRNAIQSVVIDSKGKIFTAAGSKLYSSLDKGKKWQVAYESEKPIVKVSAFPDGKILIAVR